MLFSYVEHKKMKYFTYMFYILIILTFGCKNKAKPYKTITKFDDYSHYLYMEDNNTIKSYMQKNAFWESKLRDEPNEVLYLVKAAATQSQLFSITGKIEFLIDAANKLVEANTITNYNNARYLRVLAQNYITQHKFKEALLLLQKAEILGDQLGATELLLFDVHLELENITKAKHYLTQITNFNSFESVLRISKWNFYNKNIPKAILFLEKAAKLAQHEENNTALALAYKNLADYYGWVGNIATSYNYYLKTLSLRPHDVSAKRGIAWILYSYEKDADGALKLLNAITISSQIPENHLLKAEIAEYKGDLNLKNKELKLYNSTVSNTLYGNMYNRHNTLLFAKDKAKTAKALKIAYNEIYIRPTAKSYELLAWTFYKHGDFDEALNIMRNNVIGKTFDLETLFHLAEIYKANGEIDKAKDLKEKLLYNTFKLGPLITKKVKRI